MILVLSCIAVELSEAAKILFREHPAAVGLVGIIPGEARRHPIVHSDIKIGKHENWRLKALGQIE